LVYDARVRVLLASIASAASVALVTLALVACSSNDDSGAQDGGATSGDGSASGHGGDDDTTGDSSEAGAADATLSEGGTSAEGGAGPGDSGPSDAGDGGADTGPGGGGGGDGGAMRVGMNTGPGGTVADQRVYGGFDTQLGVSTVRLFFPVYTYAITSVTDDSAPYYFKDNFDQLVNRIDGYAAQGFRITLTVSGSYCGGSPSCPPFPANLTTKRADGTFQTEFDAYMAKLVGFLGPELDKVSAVEIWNEWDDGYGYAVNGGTKVWTASQMVSALLEGGYTEVKKHSANLEVIAGGVVMNHESDIAALVDAGAAPFADAFAYHPYYDATADLKNGLAKARAAVPADRKLVLTEWGCQTSDATARATNLTASFPILRAGGVEEADYFVIFYQEAQDQGIFGLLNATLTGSDPNTSVTNASAKQPLFDAFKAGSLD
jgi:hypothetical protein